MNKNLVYKITGLISTCIIVLSFGQSVCAAETTDGNVTRAMNQFKEEKTLLDKARVEKSQDITERERQFIKSIINVFLARNQQIQKTIETRVDIFSKETTVTVSQRITDESKTLNELLDALTNAKTSAEIKDIAKTMYAQRTAFDYDLKGVLVSAYVGYIEKVTLAQASSRLTWLEKQGAYAKTQGKDVNAFEQSLDTARVKLEEAKALFTKMHEYIQKKDATQKDIENVESDLQSMQKILKDVYDLYRASAIKGSDFVGSAPNDEPKEIPMIDDKKI